MNMMAINNWDRRRKRAAWIAGLSVLALLLLWHGQARRARRLTGREGMGLTAEVRRGPLTISLVESGSIRNRERVVVRSEVEGTRNIIHLVPEGTMAEAGDLLVELDASTLEEQRLEQVARVENSESTVTQARENLEVVRNQAAADVARAELDLRFAKLALEQYEKGDYPQEVQQAEASITIADEELRRARDILEWSRKLKADGYITRSELEADELVLKRRQLDLELAQGKLKVLTEYSHVQNMEKLQSDIQQADMALERVQRRAKADIIKAESELHTSEFDLRHQRNRLARLEDQIRKCRIEAPTDGMVIYASSVQTHRWRRIDPLEPGQTVRERQELVHLPTADEMMVEFSVQEASLPKLQVGQRAQITLESGGDRVFNGHLRRIGILPDSTSMLMNPDLKLYNCEVHIDGTGEGLRQGMSCTVEIFVEQHDDALYIPLQALVRVNHVPTVYVAGARGSEPRRVRVGLDNGRMVHVIEGLEEGERVLLSPPLDRSERPARSEPDQADVITPGPNPAENEPAPDAERVRRRARSE